MPGIVLYEQGGRSRGLTARLEDVGDRCVARRAASNQLLECPSPSVSTASVCKLLFVRSFPHQASTAA